MNQLVLWLNMIAFAVLAAAAGLLYLAHARAPRKWLLFFMLYTATYGAWLLFGTYAYFQAVFLPLAPGSLAVVFAYVRAVLSFVVLGTGSLFYLELAPEAWKRQTPWMLPTIGATIFLFVLLVLGFGVSWVAPVSTTVFNGWFCFLSLLALRGIAKRSDAGRRLRGFLLYSLVAYGAFTVLPVVLTRLPPELVPGMPVNVIASGIFMLLWGVIALVTALRWTSERARGETAPSSNALATDFGVSPREWEIALAARSGETSKEIGERLFISQRTVEAHLQSVYRKCGVSNRVELTNLISRYADEQ